MPKFVSRPARLALALFLILITLAACGGPAGSGSTTSSDWKVALKIAEPSHSLGYLPLYVGIDQGFFTQEGLDVSTVTLQGGSAHTNAVLNGSAWAFIGGPEHNAFAEAKGANITALTNVVNRGNNYLVAAPGLTYNGDLGAFLKGKTIVTSAFGGTPDSIIRYLLTKYGLKVDSDVKLIETGDLSAMLSIVKQGQAQIAITSEPVLTQGVQQGIWAEPFYNVPKELGPYAYSTLNVKVDSIKSNPQLAEKFTRAVIKSLALVRDDHDAALAVARKEFPTLDPALLKTTLDRSYADSLWEYTGRITPQSVDTALAVVRAAGVLKDQDKPVQYSSIVDMTYVDKLSSGG